MDAYSGLNSGTGSFTPVKLDDYKERISYEPNGNIQSYLRHGAASTGVAMDSMNYNYQYQ